MHNRSEMALDLNIYIYIYIYIYKTRFIIIIDEYVSVAGYNL